MNKAQRANLTQMEVLGVTEYIEGLSDGIELLHFPTIFNMMRFVIFPLMRNTHMIAIMATLLPFFGRKMMSMVFRMPLFIAMMVVTRVFPPAKIIAKIV